MQMNAEPGYSSSTVGYTGLALHRGTICPLTNVQIESSPRLAASAAIRASSADRLRAHARHVFDPVGFLGDDSLTRMNGVGIDSDYILAVFDPLKNRDFRPDLINPPLEFSSEGGVGLGLFFYS